MLLLQPRYFRSHYLARETFLEMNVCQAVLPRPPNKFACYDLFKNGTWIPVLTYNPSLLMNVNVFNSFMTPHVYLRHHHVRVLNRPWWVAILSSEEVITTVKTYFQFKIGFNNNVHMWSGSNKSHPNFLHVQFAAAICGFMKTLLRVCRFQLC